ncbi:HAD family hydrolase [Catellatospora tritici]|uniref:HAD family hydrolase n=1 Tax=Catellatospora tritici TaxID=2851566 RepID=UPI001C2D502E|nr:HAD family hydrolase [Catellatospora tritici]MBV1850817.1 Cof-type HAD-IIB family hydrolase [Catellatospora tritici]MBV1851070.1 Cof-type HAD-IIB family hydrolase [Catellatospora tritici]
MRPEVVAVDLDGTLLGTGGVLSARTVGALRLAKAGGARVVVVTARPPRFVDLLVGHAGVDGLAVCANGAVVYDREVGAHEVVGPLPVAVAQRCAQVVDVVLPGATFAVETGRQVLCGPGFRRAFGGDPHRVDVGSREQLWAAAESVVKLLVWSPAHEDAVDTAWEVLSAALPDVECTHSGGRGLLEISAAGVTKAGTLAVVCGRWGVDASRVVAFGDMPNDLPMLAWAGTAYAVANAHPRVLAQVARHTASNNDDGVAQVLERLYG